jgi:predicted nucleotidyltransferase
MSRRADDPVEAGISIRVSIPADDPQLYGRAAVDDVLFYLSRQRYEALTPSELADHVDHAESTVRRAVDVLEANDLVIVERQGNRMPVRINRTRLSAPEDPVLQIPQLQFHQPVREATERLLAELDGVLGIVLYGSVARGEADRRSDVDLWVAVEGDRASNQRAASSVEADLESRRFDGDRYDFHVAVESVDSVPAFTDDVAEILRTGIVLSRTEEFETLQRLLLEEATDGK